MDCYILKKRPEKRPVKPKDLLVLNEEGNIAIFPTASDAWDFINEHNLEQAQVFFL